MSSLPEVILSVSDSGDTRHVHASDRIVRSAITTRTSLPATARSISGVAAMSSSAHMPLGDASTGASGVADAVGCLDFLGLRVLVTPVAAGQHGRSGGGPRRGLDGLVVVGCGRPVAPAAEHPRDGDDQQHGGPEHHQPPRPVDAGGK